MSKTVLVAIADGTEEIEAVTIIDVLRRAGAEVTVASVGKPQVKASRGVNLVADCTIGDCSGGKFDLIVLPGGMPGAEYLRDSKELTAMLKQQAQAGARYAAICASPAVVLQHHGLLAGKHATVYPSLSDKLGRAYVDKPVVVDGNCITGSGPGTAMAFALTLVEAILGRAKAEDVARGLLFAI